MNRILFFILLIIPLKSVTAAQSSSFDEATFYKQYAQVLNSYVSDEGLVNYAALKSDRGGLDSFLKSLSLFDSKALDSLSEAQQVAFWVNAYNAYTLKSIIDNYPIKSSFARGLVYPKNSIRQIPGVWKTTQHRVAGRLITLNDIEHEVLRKDYVQPGIHMALVCAALSCPKLRNEPFVGSKLPAQFRAQTKSFLSNGTKFKLDRASKVVHLSAIFEWFADDFVPQFDAANSELSSYSQKERSVLGFIIAHLGEEDAKYILQNKPRVRYLSYDWTLNEGSGDTCVLNCTK